MTQENQAPEWWSIQIISAHLGVSLSTVQRLRKDHTKNFPKPIRVGGGLRFKKSEVLAWLDANRLPE